VGFRRGRKGLRERRGIMIESAKEFISNNFTEKQTIEMLRIYLAIKRERKKYEKEAKRMFELIEKSTKDGSKFPLTLTNDIVENILFSMLKDANYKGESIYNDGMKIIMVSKGETE
jgi:hypothetical protein